MSPDRIDVVEITEQLRYFLLAAEAVDPVEQKRVILDALMQFGLSFPVSLTSLLDEADESKRVVIQHVLDLTSDVILEWLDGERLTDRVDEVQRRAILADQLLEVGTDARLFRIAAASLLELPDDHPMRDRERIRTAFERHIEETERAHDWEAAIRGMCKLLLSDLVSEIAGRELATRIARYLAPDNQREYQLEEPLRLLALRSMLTWRLVQAAGTRDLPSHSEHLDAARALLVEIGTLDDSSVDRFPLAMMLEESGQREEAADLFKTIVDERGPQWHDAAWIEGLIRLALGQTPRAVEVLALVVPGEEREYISALERAEVLSAGQRFGKDSANLAFAYAREGKWSEALETLERSKGARLRHAGALRKTDAGRKLLTLEARVIAARRGAPADAELVNEERDPTAARISAEVLLLEQYRRQRSDIALSVLPPPSVEAVGKLLQPDEVVVCLGLSFEGLMLIAIGEGDREAPRQHEILEHLPARRIYSMLSDTDEPSGWMLELAAVNPIDPEPALAALLERFNRELGVRLRAAFGEHVRRVTIVPHRILHAIPFWALESLSELDVRTSPSLADWYEARTTTPVLAPRVVAIGDPTCDLPLARLDAESVALSTASKRWQHTCLLGPDATELHARAAIGGVGILHFAGHGLWRHPDPLDSALLLQPDEKWGWPRSGDPLARLSRTVTEWRELDEGGRSGTTENGRLTEFFDQDQKVFERQLQHGENGSLWARYDSGIIVQCAELWTTADLLFEGGLDGCALAFLGACDSGRPPFGDIDELIGPPSSLRTSGVGAIVCALWPVSDLAALVFSQLFYRRLASCERSEVDVGLLVRECRNDLRRITSADASALLRRLLPRLLDDVSRAELEFALGELESAPLIPFSHPYHWAAFYVVGSPVIRFEPSRLQ